MHVFSDKCLENKWYPVKLCNSVFILVLHAREHVLYDFISNDFFPERKCISDRRRKRKEIQVNVKLQSLN